MHSAFISSILAMFLVCVGSITPAFRQNFRRYWRVSSCLSPWPHLCLRLRPHTWHALPRTLILVSAGPCHSSEDTKIYGSPWAGDPRGGFVVHGRLSHDNAAHSLPQHYWFRWRYTRQRCISLTRLPSRDLFFYEKPEGRARPWCASTIFI